MSALSDIAILEVFFDALRSPFGIVVEVTDVAYLQGKLYRMAKDHPELLGLSVYPDPDNPKGGNWIVRKEPLSGEERRDD